MKINYTINDKISLISYTNMPKMDDIVLCTQHIYNNPKKGQEMKRILFAKNSNYKVCKVDKHSFTVVNNLGTILSFGYTINVDKKYFFRYE